MVCPQDAAARDRLEMLYRRSRSVSLFARFGEFVKQIGAAIMTEITRDRSHPRISKFYTYEGKALWHIFDPQDSQRYTFHSEVEMCEWLERRYAEE